MSFSKKDEEFSLQKSAIKTLCLQLLHQKLDSLNQSMKDVSDASNQDSKSSAGDKHETTKAMMQIEQEKIGKQIELIRTQIAEVERIQTELKQTTVANGSLILTDQGNFYVAAALGKIKLKEEEYIFISIHSPIGNAILKSDQKSFDLNGRKYQIKRIV